MFLQNQRNNINISDVISMVKQSGLTPEQFVRKLVNEGKISQSDLNNAMKFANENIQNGGSKWLK